MIRRAALLLAAAALTACGGAGTFPAGSVVNSPGGGGGNPPPKFVNVKVTVTIPAQKRRSINPNYVSVNTHSIVVMLSTVNGNPVGGVNPKTINTVAHAHGCRALSGATVCTGTVLGAAGHDVFSVTTYAGTNGTGSLLSAGTAEAQIGSGGGGMQISNTLTLTLYGVVAALKLSVQPASAKRGDATRADVNLAAFDATGAQIVGPSNYQSAIALAVQGDGAHAFLLRNGRNSGGSLSISKPSSHITLQYDGNKQASSITLAASVDGPGSIGAGAQFNVRGRQPPPPVGTIYVLNAGSNNGQGATVTEYDGKATGNVAPLRTLNLSSKLFARSIAVDATGNLYVGYFDNQYGFAPSSGTPDTGNQIAVYAPGATGNDQPVAVIKADKQSKTTVFPLFMSLGSSGTLVTYGATGIDGIGGSDAVLTYASAASGPTAPSLAWAYASPTLYYAGPTGLALDPSGNFYLNGALHSVLGSTYGVFVTSASDNGNPSVSPARTIPWDSSTKLTPGLTTNVSLDTSGEIFVANSALSGSGSSTSCQGQVNVYAAGSSGGVTDVPPLRSLTLAGVYTQNPQCNSPRILQSQFFPSITYYGSRIFVVDDFNNAVDVFKSQARGTVRPTTQISGSSTGLNAPIASVITATH
ncbi:MAG: hypothetical protein JO146_05800 [Candidatus Eremiobacteraeota bacterium]|nr:hypothetical protein [Candidatus Eremiobacteraeota bacterium]